MDIRNSIAWKTEFMKYRLRIDLVLSIILLCLTCCSVKNKGILIRNVNIVNVSSGTIIPKQDVLLNNGRITSIQDRIEGDADTVIDGTGKYLMPGLWDMHAHVHNNIDTLKRFLQFGITSIRDPGIWVQELDSLEYFLGILANNKGQYPDYLYGGYILNGEACEVELHKTIKDSLDLVNAVQELHAIGASFIKIHNCFPGKLLPQLYKAGSSFNMPIVGHIPNGLSPHEACKYMKSIEHVDILVRSMSFLNQNPAPGMAEAFEYLAKDDSLNKALFRNNTYVSTTLVASQNFYNQFGNTESHVKMRDAVLKRLGKIVQQMNNEHVRVLAATDFGLSGLEAGKCLHDELELMVNFGMTPSQVLKAATITPASFFNMEERKGSIEIGKDADVVLLSSNPLEKIQAIREIEGVFKYGVLQNFR